jgi:hypothetical protein
MILHDILDAWNDYVDNTIVVTVTSAGVPSGQGEFNPGEKVKYDLSVTNGTAANGVQVNNIRLHLRAGTAGVFNFIVPPTSKANAFPDATSTIPLTPNSEQTAMFLETTSLATLTPGEVSTISGLEVIGKSAGTTVLEAHVHATLKLEQILPPDTTGKDGTKSLTVKT